MNNGFQYFIKDQEKYKIILSEIKKILDESFYYSKKFVNCKNCDDNCPYEHNPKTFLQKFPEKCSFRFWQTDISDKLNNKYSQKIKILTDEILKTKDNYHCKKCGLCCKFACSELSYSELQIKASNGDEFAKDFISIFSPIEDTNHLNENYLNYKELLQNTFKGDIYFYQCSKNDKNNLCTDYENRPKICRDFPSNIFCIIPECCGYKGWEKETEENKMKLIALDSIVEYYKKELEKYL